MSLLRWPNFRKNTVKSHELELPETLEAVASQQLLRIFKEQKIDPTKYVWADVWGGQVGTWSQALSKLSGNKVSLIDMDPPDEKTISELQRAVIEVLTSNTVETPLPKEITAIFLRSSIDPSLLFYICQQNPSVRVLVHIPVWDQDRVEQKQGLDFLFSSVSIQRVESGYFLRGPRSRKAQLAKKGTFSSDNWAYVVAFR